MGESTKNLLHEMEEMRDNLHATIYEAESVLKSTERSGLLQ